MFKKKHRDRFIQSVKANPILSVVLGLVTVFLIIQMTQFYRVRHSFIFLESLERNNSHVIEELGLTGQYLTDFGTDLNQIREFLLLPTKNYDFFSLRDELTEEGSEDLTAMLFTFVDELSRFESNQVLYESNLSQWETYLTETVWTDLALRPQEAVYSDIEFIQSFDFEDQSIMKLSLGYDGNFELNYFGGSLEFSEPSDFALVEDELNVFIETELSQLKENIESVNAHNLYLINELFFSEEFQSLLVSLELTLGELSENEDVFYYSLMNGDLVEVARFSLVMENGFLLFVPLSIHEDAESSETLNISDYYQLMNRVSRSFEDTIDTRTNVDRLIEKHILEFEQLLSDPAFISVLEAAGYQFADRIETSDRILYPLLDQNGEVLRSIYIDKSNGSLQVDYEGNSESLASAIEGFRDPLKKKTLESPRIFRSAMA